VGALMKTSGVLMAARNVGAASVRGEKPRPLYLSKPFVAGVVTVCVAVTAVWLYASFGGSLPPINSDPIVLAKFVNTRQFNRLDEHRRRPYMKVMRGNAKLIADAFQSGRLTQSEYEQAYFCGWMDRQIDHMHDYFRQPESKREQFLKGAHAAKLKTAVTIGPVPPHEAEVRFVQEWVSRWPEEKKEEWDEFRRASKRIKEAASKTGIAQHPAAAPASGGSSQKH
jgi:hypothetical protein